MELVTQIRKFIVHPLPLWETTLTNQLVQHQWEELKSKGLTSSNDYSTARVWFDNPSLQLDKKIEIAESTLRIEMPSFQLQSFYDEHGLELLTENEMKSNATHSKLSKALSILRLIEPAYNCVTDLVRSIHILRQSDVEIDLSYSHPKIPFSIFLSLCEDHSTISNLRVSESILHEAMHLKLTLIEDLVPLVKPNTNSVYFSPWRDEERPVKGVLHGLFVFRAIMEFYKDLHNTEKLPEAEDYFRQRCSQIKNEIAQLKDFEVSSGLTEAGANLAISLLPLN